MRLALALPVLLLPGSLCAQEGWNTPQALELVARASALRQAVQIEATFGSYQADARGYVYFFLDREDTDERVLVKTDQVALEIYWKAPDSTRQRIVGLRDQKALPTNIRYHLDHLTVVQDEFADVIRLGDGDEVAAVVHPVAPGADAVYDYHVADSITLRYGGGNEIRVYEVEVKPKDLDRPGFLGSLFLERETAAIVRMNFTFTPSSYVDEYLDYIRISLDNSVWDERYWLPYEQSVELRREVPFLDFPAGSVIRGRYEIRNYRFDPDLDPSLFLGPRVTALPEAARQAFAFAEPLHAQLDQEGLGRMADLDEVRAQAARLAGQQVLSGLAPARLWIPSASSALRSTRAEGMAVGAGWSSRVGDAAQLRLAAGWAFGRQRPLISAHLSSTSGWSTEAYLDRMRDLGPMSGSSGVINTFAAVALGRDYQDPFLASGIALGWEPPPGLSTMRPRIGIRWERQRSATNTQDSVTVSSGGASLYRAVRSIDDGDALEVTGALRWEPRREVAVEPTLRLGLLDGSTYGIAQVRADLGREWVDTGVRLGASADLGASVGSTPRQGLFLIGGRGTLPGYTYRSFVGDRFWLIHTEVSQTVRPPWVRLGGQFSMGGTGLDERWSALAWDANATSAASASAGLFAELFWDVLRVDLSRGLNGGRWVVELEVTRRFHPWL